MSKFQFVKQSSIHHRTLLIITIIIKILFILDSERKHECLSRPAESTHNTFTQQAYTFNKE